MIENENIMNAKQYLVVAIALNTVSMTFSACMDHQPPSQTRERAGSSDVRSPSSRAAAAKFGPTMETVLPAATTESTEILDLETGRALPQERFEHFNFRADAIMAWLRSHGLDISCKVWSGGAACITYDMAINPVTGKCWEQITEQELLGNPALAPAPHSPRRLLVLGQNRPDTYVFRTGEGTFGMLQLVGLSQHGQGMKIRYKLINPAKSAAL